MSFLFVFCYYIAMRAKPFIKWVGGKTQLLDEIRKHYPEKVDKYCEPFVGGGAVLFDVLSKYKVKEVLINDINEELINTYISVRDKTDELVSTLLEIQDEYYESEDRKSCYLSLRSRFNALILSHSNTVEKAALFIALNKTCFNGLYRVNSNGLFNVPHNGAVHPLICDEENIRACAGLLKNAVISLGDYRSVEYFVDDNTFLYVDPPYRPLTLSSSFTSYNKGGFTDKNQIELGSFLSKMSERGARILLSNSDPRNVDENDSFFDDLYKDFDVERVKASRMINSNAARRGAISELLIASK